MKKSIIIVSLVIVALVAFVLYTFVSTGYFREINNSADYEVIAKVPLYGAEDLTISYEDEFMIVSQDDRGAFIHGRKRKGGLFKIDLSNNTFEPTKLDSSVPVYPHGISLMKIDSGHYQLLVVNHYRDHTIEQYQLYDDSLVHEKTYTDPLLISPNDVVMLDENRFYFTNDHGYTSKVGLLAENYLGLNVSNVVFFRWGIFQRCS